jgi:hypothetical protein
MKRSLALLAAGLMLASCAKTKAPEAEAADAAAAPTPIMMIAPPAVSLAHRSPHVEPAAEAAAAPSSETAPRIAVGPPMLAYSYSYGLSLPHRQVDGLRRHHEQACVSAGYRVCQVVASSISDQGDGAVLGELTLRAAPAWLAAFRRGLEGEAKGAGGRIVSSDVTSQDLSREIVDTQAQLRAKLALRDRLQGLLANRPGRLGDLLAVERELARVQAEIDSTQSQLAVMQSRVAMSDLAISYAADDVIGAGVRSPLAVAFGGFLGSAAESLAGMVRLAAVSLPWAVVITCLIVGFRRRLPKLHWPFTKRARPATAGPPGV